MSNVTLSSIIDIISGGTPDTSNTKYWNGNIGWLSVNDFNNDLRYVYNSEKKITELGLKKSNTNLLEQGDIIISARGTVGALAQIGSPMCFNQSCFGIRGKKGKVSTDYLYYALKNYTKNIIKRSQGSVFNTINLASFDLMKIQIHDSIQDQHKITKVLSDLDKKIEINNKINSKLDSIVKLIYDYWFLQFDFPDESGKPYKSSGGKMVYNEVLKRKIPDGWDDISLDNAIVKSGTGLNPRNNFKLGEGDNFYITIKNIKNGKIIFNDKTDRISDKSLGIINQRSDLQIGDVLFTSIDPVGVTYFIQEKPKNWNINESVFTLRADEKIITPEFLFVLLSSQEMKVFTKQSSAGSIHKGIRHEVLKNFKLPYGGMPVILAFSKILRPLLKRQFMLDAETQKLNELRDLLLPMLMNNQITISEAN